MYALKTIFKTYLGSLAIAYLYLWLNHERFALGEIQIISVLLLLVNMMFSIAYVIAILIPFGFLFKARIAASTFNKAIHSYLFYFALLPLLMCIICVGVGLDNVNEGIQFSLFAVNFSSIIYLGLIYFLKYKTLV
jgi:hypothetical protein